MNLSLVFARAEVLQCRLQSFYTPCGTLYFLRGIDAHFVNSAVELCRELCHVVPAVGTNMVELHEKKDIRRNQQNQNPY